MELEDEVSLYRRSAVLAGRGTIGHEGTHDCVVIGLRESERPGAEEVEA